MEKLFLFSINSSAIALNPIVVVPTVKEAPIAVSENISIDSLEAAADGKNKAGLFYSISVHSMRIFRRVKRTKSSHSCSLRHSNTPFQYF